MNKTETHNGIPVLTLSSISLREELKDFSKAKVKKFINENKLITSEEGQKYINKRLK